MAAINFPDPNVSNPETGNPYKDGWYNSSNGVTYVYTNGVWRAASSEQSFEDIFVNKSGDDMTGNLTLGTDNITLNATDGSAEFAGNKAKLYSTGSLFVGNITGDSTQNISGSGVSAEGTVYSFHSSTSNRNAFEVYNFNVSTAEPVTTLRNNGSAKFAGEAEAAYFTGIQDSANSAVFRGTYTGSSNAFNAVIYGDGSASFAGPVNAGSPATAQGSSAFYNNGAASALYARNYGAGAAVTAEMPAGSTAFRVIRSTDSVTTAAINGDGSAGFLGNVDIGVGGANGAGLSLYTDGRSYVKRSYSTDGVNGILFEGLTGATRKFSVNTSGVGYFQGGTTTDGFFRFNLEPDNAAHYTTTTDSEGNETSVYNGPTLDVKDRLSKADAALQTLKIAAAAASDFASLKAAIATALADV